MPFAAGGSTDAELVRRCLAGNPDSFEDLVRRHHQDLLRVLRRITRNIEDAEDLSQEAFLRAYRALDRFDLSRPFRPWLWTIGIRLALQWMAKKERGNLSLDGLDSDPDCETRLEGSWLADTRALDQIEGSLLLREMDAALLGLDPQHRTILILRAVEEQSYEEIAEMLSIPVGTVMSRLSRARMRLREKMQGWKSPGDADERAV